MRDFSLAIAVGGIVLLLAIVLGLALGGSDRNAVLGASTTSTPIPTATPQDTPIPPITPPSGPTPTVPVTLTLHPEWYPTTQPYFVASPGSFVSSLAFRPGTRDILFTVNKAYERGQRDLFEAKSDETGDLTGETLAVTGLEDDVEAIEDVQSSSSGDALALLTGTFDGASDVWYSSVDGSTAYNMTRGEVAPLEIRWLPDGSAVDMLTEDGSLQIIDPSSLARTIIATGLEPLGSAMARRDWAPDSASVVIEVIDANLRPQLDVVYPVTETRTTIAAFPLTDGDAVPVYAADGGSVFAFVTHYDSSVSSYVTRLYSVDLSPLGAPVVLADLSLPSGERAAVTWPIADPDGTHLYYVQNRQLWRINTDGTGRRSLAGSAGSATEWVSGPVAFTTTPTGDERIAWTASEFMGLEPPLATLTAVAVPVEWVSTMNRLYSADPADWP